MGRLILIVAVILFLIWTATQCLFLVFGPYLLLLWLVIHKAPRFGRGPYAGVPAHATGDLTYFVRDTGSGLIKIGVSRNPMARLATLQTANPHRLELLATTAAPEATMQSRFKDLHARGEWYRPGQKPSGQNAALNRDEPQPGLTSSINVQHALRADGRAQVPDGNASLARIWSVPTVRSMSGVRATADGALDGGKMRCLSLLAGDPDPGGIELGHPRLAARGNHNPAECDAD